MNTANEWPNFEEQLSIENKKVLSLGSSNDFMNKMSKNIKIIR